MRLENRVAVITGGARGIGRATAEVFAREGARVVFGDLLAEEGEATAAAIRAGGGDAVFVRTDVTKEADCAALVSTAVDRHAKLDVLVCCAGILRGACLQADVLEESTFASVLDVNVKGTFLTVRQAVPWMRQAGSGVILLLSSGAGVKGPSSSLAYGASKGAVHGFAMTLEDQLAPLGIRVNDVCPGAIATAMKIENVADRAWHTGGSVEEALARAKVELGDPLGVASLLAFLASPEADYVRGTVFTR